MAVQTHDGWQDERKRRLSILMWLVYVCGSIVLVLGVLLVVLAGGVIDDSNRRLLIYVAALLVMLAVAGGLGRAGYLDAGSHLLFLALLATDFATSLPAGTTSPTLFGLYITIVGATLLLRPFWSFGYAALSLLIYVVLYWIGINPVNKTVSGLVITTVLFGGNFGVVALLSFLAARGYERQLSVSRQYTKDLEHARTQLEERVAERTHEIQRAMEELQLNAETIQQLSAPLLPVADAVLALPLVGALDSKRTAFLTERLLEAISRDRARMVLIDITGVPLVDTQVARALLRAAQAVRLLGAEPVLVGVRAEVAQMLVGLGVDLGDLVSLRDMRSGLAYAFERQEMRRRRSIGRVPQPVLQDRSATFQQDERRRTKDE